MDTEGLSRCVQAQMAELFETDRTSIVRLINNIYRVDELEREATCAKIAQVQTEGKRQVTRTIPYFNLDKDTEGLSRCVPNYKDSDTSLMRRCLLSILIERMEFPKIEGKRIGISFQNH